MPSLAIDLQRRRHSVPGWRDWGRWLSTRDLTQFADLINIGYFQSRICNPNAHPFDLVPDLELAGVVSSGTNCDSKIATISV
jgi:hypothetical protein